jgi:hypothetical protein
MTLSRIMVDKETGKTREQAVPEFTKHASDQEIARRKQMEAERRRRFPHDALNPKTQANHPTPTERAKAMEDAGIRENPEGGETQGVENPEVNPPKEKKRRGKDSGTEPSEEGAEKDEETPEDTEEES